MSINDTVNILAHTAAVQITDGKEAHPAAAGHFDHLAQTIRELVMAVRALPCVEPAGDGQ